MNSSVNAASASSALSAGPAAASPASRHVFVYGTLRRGEMNDINRLSPAPRFIGTSAAHGTLYDLGPYPGLQLGGDALVVGEVYEITAELEAVLDEIEEVFPQQTGEYARRRVTVRVESEEIECLVYEIHPTRVAGKAVIPSGDWLVRR